MEVTEGVQADGQSQFLQAGAREEVAAVVDGHQVSSKDFFTLTRVPKKLDRFLVRESLSCAEATVY